MIAPASTGRDRSNSTAVTSTAHGNKGIRSINIPMARKFLRVLIKLTAPSKEDTPAKCNEKIARSTDAPPWAMFLLNGG